MSRIIPDAALQQHIAVLGKTRSGKSSVMRGLVEDLLKREQPVCIVDPKGDWWGIKLAKDGKRPGYPVVIFGGEHADVPINAHAGAHVAELFATGNRPCLIDLGGWMVGERTRFWIDFASTLFKHTKGMRWLVVDEVHNFAPKGKVIDPDSGKALHWTNRLASEGLGKGLPMIFASQRPQKVHNDTLTSAETLIAMRVLHPSDRAAVSDWIKGCGDLELGAQVLASLAQMERGEGWVWSPEIGLGPKRVKFPMFETYDSFRPQSAEETKNLKGWAEVDLEEVKAKLGAVVKEAEANDPRALRGQIAALQRELAEMRKSASSLSVDPTALNMAREEGHSIGYTLAMSLIDPLLDRLGYLDRDFVAMIDDFKKDLERIRPHATASLQKREVITRPSLQKARPVNRSEAVQAKPAMEGLTSPQQRVLDALAWWESIGIDGPDKGQVGFIAGYRVGKNVGGTFGNILGQLRSTGLIGYPAPNAATLTAEGRKIARQPAEAPTTDALQRAIRERLDGPEWRVLSALIETYPDDLTKQDCGARAGYTVGENVGGTFGNILGRLRSLGLIEYPSPGRVVALPVLFLQ